MNLDPSTSLRQAEEEVRESNLQVEEALNHLKLKVDDGVGRVEKFLQATKNPMALLGITFVVGIFLGQLMRISYRNQSIGKSEVIE